jgi:hypothetical protein
MAEQGQPTTPLSAVNPKSLDELFSADPDDLTKPELELVVKEMRAQAARWQVAEAAGKRSAPKVPKASASPGLSLEDLGLLK